VGAVGATDGPPTSTTHPARALTLGTGVVALIYERAD
jgi:hypothetical protein